MTARRKPAPRATVAVPAADLGEIKDGIAKVRDANHANRNREQLEVSLERAADRVLERKLAAAPPPSASPLPRWLTAIFATAAGVVSVAAVIGAVLAVVNAYAGSRVEDTAIIGRIVALETAKAEGIAAAARMEARIEGWRGTTASATSEVETRLRAVENTIATGTRIRDQNEQSARDRIRALEQADTAYAAQVNNLATNLAGLMARMEEMLRRQERLENRLGARNGSTEEGDSPAAWWPRRPVHRL